MEWYGWVCVAIACGFVGFIYGVYIGDKDWAITAKQDNTYGRTPHYYKGKFYYIIPENEFVTEYVRRPTEDM